MNQTTQYQGTRIRQYVVPVADTPFKGDLFETKRLADKLTNFFKFLVDGGAVAIDSPWGAGKTWFAKNWRIDLEKNHGYTTVYIDAFAMDYVEDPFLMIAGELLTVARSVKPETETRLLEAGAKLGKALLPATAKVVTAIAGKWLAGETGLQGIKDTVDEAVEGLSDLAEKQIEKKLEEYENEKASAATYRKLLGELTAERTNPIIVFVDELDRCRPDFSIKTLERIKHFFEVPGVIFVLLVNGKQLTASIRGAYGQDIDADAYLRKFILLSAALPKVRTTGYQNPDTVYCKETLKSYGFPDKESVTNFADQFGALASALRLEYRDIERGCAMYAVAQPIGSSAPLAAWVIALKLWRPNLFEGIANGDMASHLEIVEFPRQTFGDSWVVDIALELHKIASEGFKTEMTKDNRQHLSYMMGNVRSFEGVFPWLCEKVNLSVR